MTDLAINVLPPLHPQRRSGFPDLDGALGEGPALIIDGDTYEINGQRWNAPPS